MSTEFNPMEDLLADLLSTWDEEPAAEGESEAPPVAEPRPEPLTLSSPVTPQALSVIPPLPVISALPIISALKPVVRQPVVAAEPPLAVQPEPVLPPPATEPVVPVIVAAPVPEPPILEPISLEDDSFEAPEFDSPIFQAAVSAAATPEMDSVEAPEFDLPLFDSPIFQTAVSAPEPVAESPVQLWAEDPGAAAACAAILARMEREFAEREPVFAPTRSRFGSDLPRYVIFGVREMMFAVPIGRVLETDRMTPVTPLPGAAPGVKGLTNLRGEVVPVIDLRDVLGWAPPENPTGRRMLVIQDGNHQPLTALLVDQVKGLAAFPATAWKSTEMAGAHAAEGFVEAVAERDLDWVSRLNLDRILTETHLPSLAAA